MNYSERHRHKRIKRLCIFSACCIGLGALTGSLITGSVMKKDIRTVKVSEKESQVIYGTKADVVDTGSDDFCYQTSDDDFTPLDVDMDEGTQRFVYALSESYGIDWTMVMAIISTESNFKPDIVSTTDDYGLMQINAANHQWLSKEIGITDFLDPEDNIRSGVYILYQMFKKYGNDEHKVLTAYHLGQGNAEKLFDNGVTATVYSNKVIAKQAQYREYLETKGD